MDLGTTPHGAKRLAIVMTVALALAGALVGCSGGTDHGTEGFRTGGFTRTINVWLDEDGPFTCPPEGPIATSDPPQCAAKTGDRVRLQNKPIWSYVAASPQAGAATPGGTWIGTAKVTGRSVDGGFAIETETVDPQ